MKISIKAILVGYIIGLVLSFAVSTSYSFSYINVLSELSQDTQQLLVYLVQAIYFLIRMLAGYIAATIAKNRALQHGAILGLFSWISSFAIQYSILVQHGIPMDNFRVETLIGLFLTTGACILGAFIRSKITEKREKETEFPLEQKIDDLGNH